MSALTHRMKQCFDIIDASIQRSGVAPSYNEIASQMGLKSRGRICMLINGLEARGKLRRLPGCPRGISIVDPADETDALAFLDTDTKVALRAYCRRERVSVETGLADVARKFFMGRVA